MDTAQASKTDERCVDFLSPFRFALRCRLPIRPLLFLLLPKQKPNQNMPQQPAYWDTDLREEPEIAPHELERLALLQLEQERLLREGQEGQEQQQREREGGEPAAPPPRAPHLILFGVVSFLFTLPLWHALWTRRAATEKVGARAEARAPAAEQKQQQQRECAREHAAPRPRSHLLRPFLLLPYWDAFLFILPLLSVLWTRRAARARNAERAAAAAAEEQPPPPPPPPRAAAAVLPNEARRRGAGAVAAAALEAFYGRYEAPPPPPPTFPPAQAAAGDGGGGDGNPPPLPPPPEKPSLHDFLTDLLFVSSCVLVIRSMLPKPKQ